jgi:4'-phosphopantetheinyl transferase
VIMNPQLSVVWQKPPSRPSLKKNEVHVWLIDINKSFEQLSYLSSLLSFDERRREELYRVELLYHNFIVVRGWLRKLLGEYLACAPEGIHFQYGENGKPFVDGSLYFNLSHSKGVLLIAFSRDHEVGIDVQYKQVIREIDKLSLRFFSKQESDEVLSVVGDRKIEVFYHIWVRKEAYTKAVGGKIFDVLSLHRNNNLHIHKVGHYFEELLLGECYAGALATKIRPTLKCLIAES